MYYICNHKFLLMKFNIKYLFALIPIVLVSGIIYYLSDIVTYILIAWVISMVGAPVVVLLRKFMNKNIAAILTLSLFVLSFLLLVWIFVPPLVNQVENLSKVDYNRVVLALEEPIKDWEQWLVNKKLMIDQDSIIEHSDEQQDTKPNIITHQVLLDSLDNQGDTLSQNYKSINLFINIQSENPIEPQSIENKQTSDEDFFGKFKNMISDYLNPATIQTIFGSTVNAFGNIIVGVFSVFFIGFFFLREQGLFDNIIAALVPVAYEGHARQAVDEISKLLIRYFIGIFFQVGIITVLVSVPLTILGIKNALLIGFFAGVMNVIPYIGPIIGAGFGVMITLSSNLEVPFYSEMVPTLFKVITVFGIMQLIDNVLLQPNIFSKSVKAHPLEIFIIIMVGAKIGGILGMVLAIPFYTAFRVIGKVFLSEFKVIQKLTKNM
jgi:predicted PurR-regulated permease PerM